MKRNVSFVLLMVLAAMLLTGCYWNRPVQESQVGLRLDSGRVIEVVPAGRYSGGWFGSLDFVSISAIDVNWSDPSLITHDQQPIGMAVYMQVKRNSTQECVLKMWREFHAAATDDEALRAMVLGRIPDMAKNLSSKYQLGGILGTEGGETDRAAVRDALIKSATERLGPVCIDVVTAEISNVEPDAEYTRQLAAKANSKIAAEVSVQNTITLQQQKKEEEAATERDLVIAKRDNQLAQERAKVYQLNPQAYELEKLKLIAQVLAGGNKWYFVEPGLDLTLLFNGNGEVVPVNP
jgi:regulator of protease activity HflC (stomatin/prohibitin superfamily)